MTNRSKTSRQKECVAFLLGMLAAIALSLVLIVQISNQDASEIMNSRNEGYEAAQRDWQALVSDRPIVEGNHMPLWLQTDPQWSEVPYAGDTIRGSGCGLVCAAMALKYMTLQDVTPSLLADYVGDECLTGGVNDPGKFCAWIKSHYEDYEIESSDIYFDTDRALSDVHSGWLVFAGMSGKLGDSEYGGHVVLIWHADDGGWWLRDPDSGTNSAREFTQEELEAVNFKYFYSIRGGLYGN